MRKVWGIARYTFIEILRNKIWYVLVLFSGILILSTLLLGTLGGEQKARLIMDLGLASIESIAFLSTVFAAVTLVLEEMESRTLYLILTRPVARAIFILGRFLGLIGIMTCAYLMMAGAHAFVMTAIHIPLGQYYVLSLFYSWEKIVVITAVALVFSLFSTSTASAITFTFFFWIMGHFSSELIFVAHKASQPALSVLCRILYYIFPNFQIMNIRDLPPNIYDATWLWAAGGYGLFYTCACLSLTALLFHKKGILMRPPRVLVWMFITSFLATVSLASFAAYQYRDPFPPLAASLSTPAAQLSDFVGIALGFRKLTADIAWIQTLLYYGTQEPGTDLGEGEGTGNHYPLFLAYCQRVARIDPSFKHIIYYGGGVLGWNLNRLDEAEQLIEEGIRTHPKEWRFQQYLAALAYQKSHNINKLTEFLKVFVEEEDCPNILRCILANIYKKQGRYLDAIRIWTIVYKTGDLPYLKRAADQIHELYPLAQKAANKMGPNTH